MKRSFSLWIAVISSVSLVAGLSGCGGGPKVIAPDADAGQEKPGPQGKNRGKAVAGKAKPKRDSGTAQAKSDGDDKSPPEGKGFHLPDDKGGKLLADLLPPHRLAPPAPSGHVAGPERSAPARFPEKPDLPLLPNQADLPQPRLEPPARSLRPRTVLGADALTGLLPDPLLPHQQELPDAARVRVPSPEINHASALPTLAQPLPDRAPVTDPTVDISTKAAMVGSVSPRTTPAPFLRLNLPDPFEHRQVIRLRKRLKEDRVPLAQGSSRPAK
jgi:hypothetical protein